MTPPDGTEALVFDCDGTLVDTIDLYRTCWRQTLLGHGFDMSDEFFDAWLGSNADDFLAAAMPAADTATRARAVQETQELIVASVHLLEPLDHVVAVARRYHGAIPMAVASGGHRDLVRLSLEAVGILDLFDAVVTVEDVAQGKPAPDTYVKAMELLGVDPSRCVAYEDTAGGMASAVAAGIPVVVDVRRHEP